MCQIKFNFLHFSDPTLCKQFSLEALMTMAGKHSEFALRILESEDVFQESHFLSKLGQHDLTVAQTILETPSLHRKLFFDPDPPDPPDSFDIIDKLRRYFPFFPRIPHGFSYSNNVLLKEPIVALGQYHPPIAWKAFTPDLEKDLILYDLCRLAPSSPDILQHIIGTPSLFNKIRPITVSTITKNCPETAMRFFKGELAFPATTLTSHSAEFFAKCLLSSHLEIAKEILRMDIEIFSVPDKTFNLLKKPAQLSNFP